MDGDDCRMILSSPVNTGMGVVKKTWQCTLRLLIAALPVIFGLPALASPGTTGGGPRAHYSGCLMFFDDFDNRDSERLLLDYFAPQRLLRSWYRFGEPSANKDYRLRRSAVEALEKQGILLGGGGSLSIVNELDLGSSDFNREWLSVNLDGTVYRQNDRWYGTLSHPGFRAYLIGKALEQVKVGVKELHFGETNGKIRFDDYSLGLAGDCGFVQWIRKRYETRDAAWWVGYLGKLGTLISNGGNISRVDFIAADTDHQENFRQEWGRPDSWHGTNDNDQPAFLAYLYSRNLDRFISELREELAEGGFDDVSIDIWGLADWIVHLRSKPDAVIESVPDRRWGFDWSRPDFPTDGEEERIKKIMGEMREQAEPAQMIFAIDHPQPFGMFRKLLDGRQAELLRWFYEISRSMGANFLFRSYSLEQEDLGPATRHALRELCRKARQ